MLYGIEPVAQALRHPRRRLHALYHKPGRLSPRLKEILRRARSQGLAIEERSVHELGNLTQDRHHQGVVLDCGPLPVSSLEEFLETLAPLPASSLLVALDQVEDPRNLGSITRSAAFLGAQGLIVLRTRSAPLSAVASKASAGTLEFFPIVEVSNLSTALQRLQKEDFFVVGATLDEAVDYRGIDPPARCVLVLGAEGSGLRKLTRRRCDQLVMIPREERGLPAAESLNVGVAAGILLAHFRAS